MSKEAAYTGGGTMIMSNDESKGDFDDEVDDDD